MSQESRNRLLEKVQKLLSKAESSPFSEEAQSFRQKADELMTLHAIESFELEQAGKQKRTQVIKKSGVEVCGPNSVIRDQLVDLFGHVASHCRVRAVYHGLRAHQRYSVAATLVGFEEDIEYFSMLYTGLRMALARDISPSYDPDKTKGENVRRMKEAGMKWERIAQLCDIPFPGPESIKIYKKQCKLDGVEPIKANPTNYVRNFAEGFNTEINRRLLEIRKNQEVAKDNSMALVVFKDKRQRVDEAVREFFPKLSYAPARSSGKFNGTARARGQESGSKADISGGRGQTTTSTHGRALGK